MTNPENAGADIEKELAEKYGIDFADIRRTHIGSNVHAVTAALLAEAGERAKLEARLDEALKEAEKAHALGLHSHSQWLLFLDQPELLKPLAIATSYKKWWEATERAEAEAERARGLEAQLETVRDIAAKMKHVLTTGRELSGWFEIIEQYERLAALSQLPTP